MKNLRLIFLILTCYYSFGQKTHVLEFDESGKLISEPPVTMKENEILEFRIYVKPQTIKEKKNTLLKKYTNTFNRIGDVDCYLIENGLDENCFKQNISDLKADLNTLIVNLKNNTASGKLTTSFIPKIEDIIIPKYKIKINYLEDNNIVTGSDSKTITGINFSTIINTKDDICISTKFVVADKTRKINYEISEQNNYSDWIEEKLKNNPNAFDDNKIFFKNNASLISKIINTESAILKPIKIDRQCTTYCDVDNASILSEFKSLNVIDKDCKKQAINESTLEDVFKTFSKTICDLSCLSGNWLLSFVWINDGVMTANPFEASKSGIIKLETLNKSLRNATDSLDIVKDKIQLTLQILKPEKNENRTHMTKDYDLQRYLITYEGLLSSRKYLEKRVEELKNSISKTTGENNKINNRVNDFDNLLKSVKYLHNGLLYVNKNTSIYNPNTPYAYTRYHDASANYNLMHRTPQNEILENERMYILVENNKPQTKLSILPQVNNIKFEFSALENAIMLVDRSTTFINPAFIVSPLSDIDLGKWGIDYLENLPDISGIKLFESYKKALFVSKIYQNDIFSDFQSVYETDPRFSTKELNISTNKSAPYEVKYDISIVKDGKDSVTTTKISPSYSVFRLHRFRFKMGLAYSGLQEKNISIDNNNVPSSYTLKSGLNVTFGLQTFIMPQNIRNPKLGIRPYIYTGLKVTKDLTENFFLGIGSELFNGVGFCLGYHLGKTNELLKPNGTYIISDKKWTNGIFTSLLLDTRVFNRIFDLTNINNPFARK